MSYVSRLWLTTRFKVDYYSSGMTGLVSTYCYLGARHYPAGPSIRINGRNMIMRSWERYCFHFRLPAVHKKAAALDKKRSLIFHKDVLKIGVSLSSDKAIRTTFGSKFWRWKLVIIPRRTGGLFVGNLGNLGKSENSDSPKLVRSEMPGMEPKIGGPPSFLNLIGCSL